jgi:hypothetical protein
MPRLVSFLLNRRERDAKEEVTSWVSNYFLSFKFTEEVNFQLTVPNRQH